VPEQGGEPSRLFRRRPRPEGHGILSLLSLPHARAVSELEDFLDAYAHVVGDVAVRGNLVPDGHIAAILFQHGVRTLYTNDRDFRKFESLDVKDPFA
jgi:predicted nucleic acid-binding protein